MRCFATLAEELHFGRAAAMAQPALSVQIQTLERELGVQLLTRFYPSRSIDQAWRTFL
ncbi:LysR family transcriptional regulator (plasmid) [Sinorhizobium meliloti RU11/001]|nr:LysR family transcriptional regulator [Sinorhizobium meliloti RU11/001]